MKTGSKRCCDPESSRTTTKADAILVLAARFGTWQGLFEEQRMKRSFCE
jgi:hypothetical protein